MARYLATLSLLATALFVVAIAALQLLRPDVNPASSGISFYGLGRYGLILGIALVLVGLSGIALALALWPTTSSALGRSGLVLLIAWGLLQVLAGLFPVDAPGGPTTVSGTIHNLAGMNFVLIPPALLLIGLAPGGASGSRRPIAFWLGGLLLASAMLLFLFQGPLHSSQVGGLFQRLYWLVLMLAFVLMALQVRRRERAAEPKRALR